MCDEEAVDISSLRCLACHLKCSEKDIIDGPCSGQPAAAVMMETKVKVDVPFQDDHSIKTGELCTALGIGRLVVMAIIRELGYRKFCIN